MSNVGFLNKSTLFQPGSTKIICKIVTELASDWLADNFILQNRKNALARHRSMTEASQNLRQIEIPQGSKCRPRKVRLFLGRMILKR